MAGPAISMALAEPRNRPTPIRHQANMAFAQFAFEGTALHAVRVGLVVADWHKSTTSYCYWVCINRALEKTGGSPVLPPDQPRLCRPLDQKRNALLRSAASIAQGWCTVMPLPRTYLPVARALSLHLQGRSNWLRQANPASMEAINKPLPTELSDKAHKIFTCIRQRLRFYQAQPRCVRGSVDYGRTVELQLQ